MCGVSGYAGLGYLSADIRFDLVEALGCGIDQRGGHASGAVVVTDEGPPRLMRKLGKWGQARGRFIRAASQGHSVMMHARWATTGAKDEIENAHPFAIKRTDADSGKEVTILYGCHNGVLYGTDETAKANNRKHTVDSREFFELLADKAYETIKTLGGYGVVTYIRPEDRKVRVLRLSNQSDFVLCRLKGGGTVWASTAYILTEALKYVGLEEECRLSVDTIGRVYVLSGTEAKETKLEDVAVNRGSFRNQLSYSHSDYGDAYDYRGFGGVSYWPNQARNLKDWQGECCHVCGYWNNHKDECRYRGRVVESETVRFHKAKEAKEAKEAEAKAATTTATGRSLSVLSGRAPSKPPVEGLPISQCRQWPTDIRQRYAMAGKKFALCKDGTYRQVKADGSLVNGGHEMPMYVPSRVSGDGLVAAYTVSQACYLANRTVSMFAELAEPPAESGPPSTQRVPVASKPAEKVEDNGHFAIPYGLTKEEEAEWEELCRQYPNLTAEMIEASSQEDPEVTADEPTESERLEAIAAGLDEEFTRQWVKGE